MKLGGGGAVIGLGDGTPEGGFGAVPSPVSFVASFKENPAARADASRGRFAVVFMKPSWELVSEPVSEPV